MKKIESLMMVMVAAAALAGCSSTPVNTDATAKPAAPTGTSATPTAPTATTAPAPESKVASVVLPAHKDANSLISRERSVYFDYDDFSVKPEFRGVIENHGKYLIGNGTLNVRVEGHADERGSTEYNLALGQRRAESVLGSLKIYGVKVSQMEAVSYGEERPKASGHDEAAWAQNRRADIAYRN